MEKSFDFGRLLRNHEKKHKSKPTQFVSVAGGVQKRLENSHKCRKSSRLTIFDSIRNLSRCASPAPLTEAQQKVEHRKQQLEKWKEEKQKRKREAASQKKKPFITGVPHVSHKFVPPAPIKPSVSGRVTRSQTVRNSKLQEKPSTYQSFAPKNASFNPPLLKNIPNVPFSVSSVALKQKNKTYITFDPVLPKSTLGSINEVKNTRSRIQKETKVSQTRANEPRPSGKTTKPVVRINTEKIQSSSSSETDLIPTATLKSRKSMHRALVEEPAQSSVSQSSTDEDSSSQSPTIATKNCDPPPKSSISDPVSPILTSKTSRISTPKELMLVLTQYTPNNKVPKSESSSEEKLRSPKSPPQDMPMTSEQIIAKSPNVTMSRGKDNARRETKKKLDEGLLDEDRSDIDNIDHFRRQLASEIKRMSEMCETWDRISEQTVLPDSIQECVLGAVGQARLLMSQKMQQFATLVERCARPDPSAALVTAADLAGFWDMVFMQVENVDMRFKKLEQLRARGWVEEQAAVVAKKVKPAKVPKTKPVAGASRIKEMIAAARKAKKEQMPAPAEKTFEAGFFCVRSPVRSPALHSPLTPASKSSSLLKAVLSSEANKSASKSSASFAMLRASVLAKNAECEGVAPLPLTPLPQMNATPARSILKQASNTGKKSSKKSIKVVLFNQSATEDSSYTEKTEQEMVPVVEKEQKEEKEEKENSRRKSRRLMRQDATEDWSPMMTRSRRKSNTTPQDKKEKTRRSTRNSKVLEDKETNVIEDLNSKRTSRWKQDVGVGELTA